MLIFFLTFIWYTPTIFKNGWCVPNKQNDHSTKFQVSSEYPIALGKILQKSLDLHTKFHKVGYF